MKTETSLPRAISTRTVGMRLIVALATVIAGLTTLALAADAASDTTKKPSSGAKVYTNTDLKKYATESELANPAPPRPVTTNDSKEGWDFVYNMIDREHEKAARSKEQADAAAAAYEASKYEPEPTYYAPYYGYGYGYGYNNGCFNGDCGHGCNGPYTHRSNCSPQQTNTMRPLDERGIRTPQDLWRETRRNGAIQRSNIMAPPQGYAMVPARTPTPTPHR